MASTHPLHTDQLQGQGGYTNIVIRLGATFVTTKFVATKVVTTKVVTTKFVTTQFVTKKFVTATFVTIQNIVNFRIF